MTFASLILNLTPGVSPISQDIYKLHMTMIWICAVIGLIVFGAITYSIIYHKKREGHEPAKFHAHLSLELTWTIIPFLILVMIAIPTSLVLNHTMNDLGESDLTVRVTGYQWKWQYEILNQGVKFFSNLKTPMAEIQGLVPKTPNYLREVDEPLVLPVHKKIRFLFTSNDVIHSWWVPDFGIKRDSIPGFINAAWTQVNRPGVYKGQCAELCGINHAYMPIVVRVVTETEFNEWMNVKKGIAQPAKPAVPGQPIPKPIPGAVPTAQPAKAAQLTLDQLMTKGKEVYMNTCAACHKPDGSGMPPIYPSLKDSQVVKGPFEKHLHTVVFGVPGTAMQAFGQQFSPEDIASVITYERNELGQHKGEMIQPSQVTTTEQKGQ